VINPFFDRKNTMPPMPSDSVFTQGFMRMFDVFVETVKNMKGFEACSKKVAQWDKKKLQTAWIDIAEPMRCGFQILNHGDIWINNMMFKSDEENNPLDVSMIDFQGNFWGTPTNDVAYFLISSVDDDIKVEHFDEFVEFYLEELTKALKKLNYDQHIPTLAELHIDLIEKGYFRELTFFCSKEL
jgi:aminoglycoside phosphotransferase (APT) family kinase protein